MHNLNNEYYQNEFGSMGNEMELSPEFEYSGEYSQEYGNELELSPEFEYENPQMEIYQSELSQELMEISNEAEFGGWLKKALKKGAGLASNFLNSPTGQKATSALNDIATKTLPGYASRAGAWLGNKVGSTVGRGDYGAQLGKQGAAALSQAGASKYQDFAKFATDAVGKLAQEFETGTPPAIKPAIVKAAAKHYPIILKVKGTLHAKQMGGAMSNEYEFNNEWNGETSYEGEISHNEGTFNEVTEMELASELLSVQSEAELDQFLGKLFKKATGAVSKLVKSGTGRALSGMLKGIAKKALPIAGGALGTFLLPGVGTAIGGSLGAAAGNMFELELEGLSPEDREFEVARAYVRFAGNAARRASRMGNMPPGKPAAKAAVAHSARRFAPGLLVRNQKNYYNHNSDDQSGSWHRDGDRIIIEGI